MRYIIVKGDHIIAGWAERSAGLDVIYTKKQKEAHDFGSWTKAATWMFNAGLTNQGYHIINERALYDCEACGGVGFIGIDRDTGNDIPCEDCEGTGEETWHEPVDVTEAASTATSPTVTKLQLTSSESRDDDGTKS